MAVDARYSAADFNSLRINSYPVTPADGADLTRTMAVITCQVAGLIKVTTSGGTTDTLYCQAGGYLPVLVDRVWSTTTTATGISALYGM
jgi:hypothetical protein